MGFRFSKSPHSWTPGSFPTGPMLFLGHPCPPPHWHAQPQVIAVASPPTVIQVPVQVPVLVPTPVQVSVPSPVVPAPVFATAPPAAYAVPSPHVQMPSPRPVVIQAQVTTPTPPPPPPVHRPPSPHPQQFVHVNDNWGGAGHHPCPPQHQGPHSSLFTVNILTPLNTPLNQQAHLPEFHPGYTRQ
jgi:hypothetical protein